MHIRRSAGTAGKIKRDIIIENFQMKNLPMFFELCRAKFCCSPLYTRHIKSCKLAEKVVLLLEQNKFVLLAEELDSVREFFLCALESVCKPEDVVYAASSNSDYSLYFALQKAVDEQDMFILTRSLKAFNDNVAFAVFGYLYPQQYSLQSYSIVRSAWIIFRDHEVDNYTFDDGIEDLSQKMNQSRHLTNQLLCRNFLKCGFESPLDFSVILCILYKNAYHYKLAEKEGVGKDKYEKFEIRFHKLYNDILEKQEEAIGEGMALPSLPVEKI